MDISWNIQSFNIVHVKKNDITKRISLIFLYKNLFLFPFFIYNLILQLHVYVLLIYIFYLEKFPLKGEEKWISL